MSTITLKNDIQKLNYMIEHSSSKSKKRYYTNILVSLLYMLYDIENTNIEYEPKGQKISFINKPAVKYQESVIEQICESKYRTFINELASNGLKHLKSYQDIIFLNESFSINQVIELVLDFFNNYDKSLYPIVKESIDKDHLFIVLDKEKNTDGFSMLNTFSNNPYIVLYSTNELTLEHIHCLVH